MFALVTGAGGFLGRYIVEQLLARGDQVRGFSRGEYPDLVALGMEAFPGDIRDAAAVKAACRRVDVVFHTAALAGIWGPWRSFYETNIEGTTNVISGCLAQQVPRLVYTSSPSVTFAGRDQCGIDESAPYAEEWLAHYPHTKAEAEEFVLAANGRGGLLTCALRPHLIWGPRDTQLIPRLLDRAKRGRLRRVGNGQNLVDTVYVENAAEAHLLAADRLVPGSPVCGRAYFISQGEPVNCWNWINEILALAGLPPVKRSLSLKRAQQIGSFCETLWGLLRWQSEPPMTRFLAAQLGTSHYFNITRAREELNYQPRISQAEGMQRLGAWIRSR